MFFDTRHSRYDSRRTRILLGTGHVVAGLAIAAVMALAFGWIVMALWNHLLPDLVGARPVSFWQSVGLILLARILVGGLPHGHGHRPGRRHRMRGHAWRDYDDWWKEVGEKSFQDYTSGSRPSRDGRSD